MKTVQIIFGHNREYTFQLAHIDDEFIMYENAEGIEDDRDFWLTNSAVETFLSGPFGNPQQRIRELLDHQSPWRIEVTSYTNLASQTYTFEDVELKQKTSRRATILAGMSPADRALFEDR